MSNHFMLLEDRLLTESTLEAAIQSKNRLQHSPLISEDMTSDFSLHRMDIDAGSSPRKLVECKICKDEDEDSTMEAPCSCRGSLKYAHRNCVQRWCNEKGDTICEICHQQFKPGYTAPPPLFHYGGIPMNFRGNWEISRRDLHNPQFITMVPTGGNFLDPNFDGYPVRNTRSLMCCRVVAMIFVVLLVLRHTLPFIIYETNEYSVSLFMLLVLRTIGILLPIYIMVKALTAVLNRRNHQDSHILPVPTSDEENELPRQMPQSHHIHIPNYS
ncbi:RING/FYVE/PHD zinc finger superfamily protein [Forsythia ovata]|uniref:RING/FYVE/PHD zinc finger superfamily protein n=1 Tax=Forsythia ovata TaxID=205694 RepID=A0ABD1UBH7_9LAMI